MARTFDRVAAIYDATRALPPETEEAIAAGIARATGAMAATTFLEVGVGTGRIALPLAREGFRFAGVDLSAPMLAAARAKAAGGAGQLLLARANAQALPFADATFDVGLVVHVFHLIPTWPLALAELLRVIKPGGYFVYGSERWLPIGARHTFDQQWRAILATHGVAPRGHQATDSAVVAALGELGLPPRMTDVASWRTSTTVADALTRQTGREYSSSWTIPDEIFTQAAEEFTAWVRATYPDPGATLTSEARFSLTIARR